MFSWILCIVITLGLTGIITNFVIINANIPSGSMENTIMTGDKLIALRTAYWFSEKSHSPSGRNSGSERRKSIYQQQRYSTE